MTRLAQIIARKEGFYVPGSVPARYHNPGDLRHSPHSLHPGNPDGIGQIPDDEDGWADLERQLGLFADRGLTLGTMIVQYYAPEEENDSAAYLKFVCNELGCTADMPVADALKLT